MAAVVFDAAILSKQEAIPAQFVWPADEAPAADDGVVEEIAIPVVDLAAFLASGGIGRDVAEACERHGFFQVVNHGVAQELLEAMRREQARLFRLPFEAKSSAGLLNDSYRWGTPTATSLRQLSWSEAFHLPLAGISGKSCNYGDLTSLRYVHTPRVYTIML